MPSGDLKLFHNIGTKSLYQYQKSFPRAVAKLWAKLVNALLQQPIKFFCVGTRP
jgi:hypothetical protein